MVNNPLEANRNKMAVVVVDEEPLQTAGSGKESLVSGD